MGIKLFVTINNKPVIFTLDEDFKGEGIQLVNNEGYYPWAGDSILEELRELGIVPPLYKGNHSQRTKAQTEGPTTVHLKCLTRKQLSAFDENNKNNVSELKKLKKRQINHIIKDCKVLIRKRKKTYPDEKCSLDILLSMIEGFYIAGVYNLLEVSEKSILQNDQKFLLKDFLDDLRTFLQSPKKSIDPLNTSFTAIQDTQLSPQLRKLASNLYLRAYICTGIMLLSLALALGGALLTLHYMGITAASLYTLTGEVFLFGSLCPLVSAIFISHNKDNAKKAYFAEKILDKGLNFSFFENNNKNSDKTPIVQNEKITISLSNNSVAL